MLSAGNKKAKAAPGAPLKEVAKKAGFTPNYGCEEGKCGSCEMKVSINSQHITTYLCFIFR